MSEGLSLGRIQAGFAQASQELTVAAANFNIDFTLFKYEAPSEYQTIGNTLTPSRVREAETGPIHATARRLGALFEVVCPETPNLIKAYGIRASEISKEMSETGLDVSPGRNRNWIGTEYGGVDATSIWAAATSRKAALPVHLLACIIARMWTNTEATSVWVEIVAERKREIRSKFEEDDHVSVALASAIQQEITRDQLSKWDASARAWLQTADKARQRQYKQFLLIVKNLSIAIHQESASLFSNVIYVWTSALAAMEGLISGTSYVVREGPVLVGLSAWHIFPDMVVFDTPSGNTEILMNDPLVKRGGILSLGISDPGRRESQGIYWSLSLAHHKFYGEAVRRTRRLDVDGSRLSLNELFLVCIGSLLRCWNIPKQGTKSSVKILQAISKTFPLENQDWQHTLKNPLQTCVAEDKEAQLAVSLGRRRPTFLPSSLTEGRKSFFGLLDLPGLLFLLKNTDSKIELLRRLAARIPGLDNTNSIITCFNDLSPRRNHIFATAFPKTTNDGNYLDQIRNITKFHRWIEVPYDLVDEVMRKFKVQKQWLELTGSDTQGIGSRDAGYAGDASASSPPEGSQSTSTYDADNGLSESAPYMFEDSYDSPNRVFEWSGEKDEDIFAEDSLLEAGQTDFSFLQDQMQRKMNDDENRAEQGPRNSSTEDDCNEHVMSVDNEDTEAENHGLPNGAFSISPSIPEQEISFKHIIGIIQHEPREATTEKVDSLRMEATRIISDHCSVYLSQQQRRLKPETVEYLQETKADFPHERFVSWNYDGFLDVVTRESEKDEYSFLFGQRCGTEFPAQLSFDEHAGVYVKRKDKTKNHVDSFNDISPPTVSLDDVLWCFDHDLINRDRLKKLLEQEPSFSFLKVLAAIREIYREPAAGGATVSCSIVENTFDPPIFFKRLSGCEWLAADSYLSINRATAVALIAYFETGHNVMDGMKGNYNTIGLSGGDSIFVLTAVGFHGMIILHLSLADITACQTFSYWKIQK
jgi:hypothetical protein